MHVPFFPGTPPIDSLLRRWLADRQRARSADTRPEVATATGKDAVARPNSKRSEPRRARWLPSALAVSVEDFAATPETLSIPKGTIDWAATDRHAKPGPPVADQHGPWPPVLFSPGYAMWRELYAVVVDELPSRGYLVVSMSHTCETPAVEFPDGCVARGVNPGNDPGP